MSTIPANTIVDVVPSVLAAGGTGLTGVGLVLTHNTRLPVGTVQNFAAPAGVSAFFGPSDPLTTTAGFYFAGFQGASIQPASLLMAQFPQTAVAAYLRGGNISGLTLPQLQAINGVLTAVFDGYSRSGTVNLAAATSFSNAASLIQTALNSALPNESSVTGSIAPQTASFTGSIAGNVLTVTAVAAGPIVAGGALSGSSVAANTVVSGQLTGTPGGIGTYAVSQPQILASEALTETYGLLSVTVVGSGAPAVGQALSGTGVSANTSIVSLGTGTGGTGTYYVSPSQTAPSQTITGAAIAAAVTYDSVSGAFVVTSGVTGPSSTAAFASGAAAALLLLTSATGAVLSQGAAPQTPSAFMTALIGQNVNWVNFMTHFDPDGGSGNAVKQQFAAWKNTALGGNRFGYFCWDPDGSPAATSPAAASLGQILKANGDSGTLLIWEGASGGNPAATVDNGLCAFALGLAASVNYQQTNGRTDFAFRQGAGLVANVTDINTATNLLANGYCFYGAYGAANASYVWFQNGQITGPFAWADSFETQVWLNNLFQITLLTLFANSLSVPFTNAGIALLQQALQSVIDQGLAFGAFAPNTLTASQVAQVNAAAGANIAGSLQSQGYYLQILLPPQTVQAARGPWSMVFFYIDRNSVQQIDLSSVLVQ
jgi:hypothetical protein